MADEFICRCGLDLQVSMLACRAVESADPLKFLASSVAYHNASEFQLVERGPLRRAWENQHVTLVHGNHVPCASGDWWTALMEALRDIHRGDFKCSPTC